MIWFVIPFCRYFLFETMVGRLGTEVGRLGTVLGRPEPSPIVTLRIDSTGTWVYNFFINKRVLKEGRLDKRWQSIMSRCYI